MKKIVSILLIVTLIISNFLPIVAHANTEVPAMTSITVRKNSEEIGKTNGAYEITDLFASYELNVRLSNIDQEGYNENQDYVISLRMNDRDYDSVYTIYNGNMHISLSYFDSTLENQTLTVSLCTRGLSEYNSVTCESVIQSETFNFRFPNLAEYNYNNVQLFVNEITQDGEEIELTQGEWGSYYQVDGYEDTILDLYGENFVNDKTYTIKIGWDKKIELLGSEINNGITITAEASEYGSSPSISFIPYIVGYGTNGDYLFKKVYNTELEMYENLYTYFSFEQDVRAKNYDLEFQFSDSSLVEISDGIFYVLKKDKYDSTKPLKFVINGTGFKDKDYTIQVKYAYRDYHGDYEDVTLIDSESVVVNGNDLNNGYTMNLKYVDYEYPITPNVYHDYFISLKVGDLYATEMYVIRPYGNGHPTISSELFYESGKKNLSAFSGDGGSFSTGGRYETSKEAFSKYSSMYIRYLGNDFEDNVEYDYIIEYGNEPTATEPDNGFQTLKTGKILGKVLNTEGYVLEVKNDNNYSIPIYRMTIKKDGYLIYSCFPSMILHDGPQFANVSLVSGEKNIYLRMSDYQYTAVKNAPLRATLSGLGFDDNTVYHINYSVYYEIGDNYDQTDGIISATGKDINDGKVYLDLNEYIPKDANSASAYMYIDEFDDVIDYAIQGGFSIEFVDSSDLFPADTPYYIEDGSEMIKGIKKKTSASSLAETLSDTDRVVKVFDSTGTTEQTKYVGTGMIIRIFDANGFNVLDIDAVVKGDPSGDGQTTITDLVKMERHLTQDELLQGVYQEAAKISGGTKVTITDITKVVRDLEGIQAIE